MTGDSEPPAGGPIHRVSLACLPCRSRHLKCNATKPACARCAADGVACTYTRSRRGGRRRVQPLDESTKPTAPVPSVQDTPISFEHSLLPTPTSSAESSAINFGIDSGLASLTSAPRSQCPGSPFDLSGFDSELISDYYTYFHPAHPCIPPKWSLEQHWSSHSEDFSPLLHVMQYIGSLFNESAPSDSFRAQTKAALPIHQNELTTPYEVQAMLLFAIATYWSNEVEYGVQIMETTVIPSARALGMHHDACATQYGRGDPVLEESWRRTWWQLYQTHASMSASAHALPTQLSGLQMTVRLPSEEDAYDSGEIPQPRTLAEYDMREFLPSDDPGFSSFAQNIGVLRTMDLVITENAPIQLHRTEICAQMDVGLSAWQTLLPPAKRRLVTSSGDLDRHLFAAHMTIIAYVVDFHRSLSDLSYSSIESVARCTPPAPPLKPRPAEVEDTKFHTTKALAAIRRMGDLLPLPSSLHTITPFFVCIIATVTIAHLSACRYLFRDRSLQLERERVRLSMGALRMLGEHWPLGKRTYDEMGVIAREILCLTDKDCSVAQERFESSPGNLTPLELDMFIDTEISFFDL